MARPIRETPVLKGEDAFNFEWRKLTVDHRLVARGREFFVLNRPLYFYTKNLGNSSKDSEIIGRFKNNL